MINEIKKLREEIDFHLKEIASADLFEQFKLSYLVKKGKIQELFDKMKTVTPDEKPLVGKELNLLRKFAEEEINKLKDKFAKPETHVPELDLTLPGRKSYHGSYHPVLQILDEMVEIFVLMGFSVAEGPDIEDGFHNFDALNFAADHPARDMQDTFFIKNGNNLLLRTHTSPVQIRVMKSQKPPIRCIMPGRVYRNEAINARSLAEFHQIEGLYIDKNVSFAQLKGTLMEFSRKMYGENSKFRFRPSYFPFTEPSAELDISCFLCGGKGCRICKHQGWLEIAGCGMVHPNVLHSGEINHEEYSGFAFGFGIERVALLRTGIEDIRLFYENDKRVLEQF
ncbi:MAG: phenylalanine--tRNA ligase subunit alpha [Candidatus Kapabacteria bacterium]|nr:phenylalanine--tRNA ligase subunit alpha [Candidatus Kapabacteria bacterium]